MIVTSYKSKPFCIQTCICFHTSNWWNKQKAVCSWKFKHKIRFLSNVSMTSRVTVTTPSVWIHCPNQTRKYKLVFTSLKHKHPENDKHFLSLQRYPTKFTFLMNLNYKSLTLHVMAVEYRVDRMFDIRVADKAIKPTTVFRGRGNRSSLDDEFSWRFLWHGHRERISTTRLI